ANSGGTAPCDASNVVVTFCCPGPNGQPAPTSNVCSGSQPFQNCCTTFPTFASVPAKGPVISVGQVQCRDVATTVPASVIAQGTAEGRLESNPPVDGGAFSLKKFPFNLLACNVQVDKQVCCKAAAQCADTDFVDV